ncbi:MAG TPA: L-glutamate gamma-semialdehyde dehydrogenase [Bacteroidales bacterium]|jgi:1-pyrroline-5-carboxylate dehydrogenase|nr:1-pyrroline-5-carboxylate dehydrogenase 1 [Bacteroidales bacterium]MCZ2416551.1 L-glutamate gamma-semialdehyde dehydrogenase [Burkholderiales bacterium]MCZ2315937.1 L-glutamate gamma-semialdehyde dehydrogenase [Bacteroidales bacterium]NLZ08573.1 L-glutamate gamma-semialdehyde dehydrogenase [Bacteroidales bacterium]HNR27228.1 L-glutamate gamma-semialdehyde dehydrogenase [Bacteroidales bacterium]
MNNAVYNFPLPENEPILNYLKGSPERVLLENELKRQSQTVLEIPLIIGGKEIRTGNFGEIRMPHDHNKVIARYHKAGKAEVELAIKAALEARKSWSDLAWTIRASILLKAAELLSTRYRSVISAANMLGQSKNIYQSEIDAVCETIDFLKYNISFTGRIYEQQPKSTFNQLNKMEYRALEGFVLAVSPFNFTSIASNLNMAPVMMGNTTIWKPASTAILSNYYLMKVFMEAGLPAGVINFLPGQGSVIGNTCLASKDLAGIHFTGSNSTFNGLWTQVSSNLSLYKSYPRLVGETGGKNFVFVHPSANVNDVCINTIRGAFEYQGQKCSAASRMYVPRSLWPELKKCLGELAEEIKMGDVMNPENFMNAVIDEKAFDNIKSYIDYAKRSPDASIIAGGQCDKSTGYFIRPTIVETTKPHFKLMEEEIFGPVLCIYVYQDEKITEALDLCDTTSPYGLTGAVFSTDRVAAAAICERLRYAAGNFYINDKPTGAVVGLQPFGGSRASGTNDKAGGEFNLLRWVNPRTIKETFVSPDDYRYPYMR